MKSMLSGLLAAFGMSIGLAGCGASGAGSLPQAPSVDGSSPTALAGLPAGTWRLAAVREAGQPEVAVARPDLFTAEFVAGGQVHLRADCNRCVGSYTSDAATLHVGPMACTRAYCVATAPLDDTFTRLVSGARTWAGGDGRLELSSEAGTLRFQR